MKVTVEVDITPQEARAFLGLPDLSGVHDAFLNEAKSKLTQTAGLMDIEPLLKTWTGFGGVAQDAITSILGAAVRTATAAAATPASGAKPAAKPSDGKSKPD
jgi:hypothetical protein